MDFVAVDVETANADMSSICQIGLARFANGRIVEEWVTLVDPEDFFDFVNSDIHGISEKDVENAPKFPDIYGEFLRRAGDSICVCHTHFDRVSLAKAFEKYEIARPTLTWLDSARVVRRVWEEFAWKGYGLANVCQMLGYDFNHHDALEDAKAAGQIVVAASEKTGFDLEGLMKRVGQPIDLDSAKRILQEGNPNASRSANLIAQEGNPDGGLFGEVIVFTGALDIPRRDAAALAASVGCAVGSNVTKKTTLLVVGDQDVTRLAGNSKSSKHRKAEKLISKGSVIRIIRESDFKYLVERAGR